METLSEGTENQVEIIPPKKPIPIAFSTFGPTIFAAMKFIDTHAHMYSSQFDEDIDEAMDDAMVNGVDRILLPNISRESVEAMHRLCDNYPKVCYPMMGLHPCDVKEDWEQELAHLKGFFSTRPYVAVGEIGIDLHWDTSTLAWQEAAFRTQIGWAKELDLPIVIHARKSFDELFAILDEENDERLRGVFHCFTGSLEQAQKVMGYGRFKMGIGGVLTYKNAGLKETLREIPIEEVMLETDAPYLAPVPFRGKRNESSYLLQVAIEMSRIYERPLEEVAAITTATAERLFRLDTRP